jgi:hypothetical protein
MNTPTIILLCLLCFGAGVRTAEHFTQTEVQPVMDYITQDRARTYRIAAEQANNVVKNRRKEFVENKFKFNGSEHGISIVF